MRNIAFACPLALGVIALTTSGGGAANRVLAPVKRVPVAGRVINITARDYAFSGMPAQLPAGWLTFRMTNAGHEYHMFATAVVPHGFTPSSLEDSLLRGGNVPRLEEWGGPNAVSPGRIVSVTLYVPAGEYMDGCFVASADGKTHFDKGMMGSFRVVPSADSGVPPRADRDVTLSTYSIAMSGGAVARGTHTIEVRNNAAQTHDFVVLKLLPGHTAAQALAWFGNPPAGTAAATVIGGTTGLHTGERAFVSADFEPGTYVLVCWMQTDKKYHYQLGMERVFTVA